MSEKLHSFPIAQPLAGFLAVALVSAVSWAVLTAYEYLVLGLYPVREEVPVFTAYFLLRSLFALGIATALIGVLYSRVAGTALDREPLDPHAQVLALAVMFAALCLTVVFLADPEAFRAMAEEDSLIEWLSALLVLGAGGLFAIEAIGRARRGLERDWLERIQFAVACGFALLFFLIGMEEISWMQRLAGFDTPAEIEEINWQGEFNLHNIHTDLSETIYYTGAGIFLLLFPLLRGACRAGVKIVDGLLDFAPARSVAAISAPTAMFNYGHWNLIPIQVTAFAALLVMLAFAQAARRRGDMREAQLFGFLAGGILVGQAIFLAFGQRMIEIPNATEFKELFISIGIAWYAIERFAARRKHDHNSSHSESRAILD